MLLHLLSEDLSNGCFGQLIPEFYLVGKFISGKLALAMFNPHRLIISLILQVIVKFSAASIIARSPVLKNQCLSKAFLFSYVAL